MSQSAAMAGPLLQAGLVMTAVLLARMVLRRNTTLESVPVCLRSRVVLADRLGPPLLVMAVGLIGCGLLLAALA